MTGHSISLPSDKVPDGDVDCMVGIVYSRKKRRQRLPVSHVETKALEERMYGIPYVRRKKRRKMAQEEHGFLAENAVAEEGFLRRLDSPRRKFLFILVEASQSSLCRFCCFLVSVLNWMRKFKLRMVHFAAFLFESVAGVFSTSGIHFNFAEAQGLENHLSRGRSRGTCVIFGAQRLIPLVSLNFAAAPFYFTSLHWSMILGSGCLLGVFVGGLIGLLKNGSQQSISASASAGNLFLILPTGDSISLVDESTSQNEVLGNGLKLWKHRRKRSALRSRRVPKHSLMNLGSGILHSETKRHEVVPIHDRVAHDFFCFRDDGNVLKVPTEQRQKKSHQNSLTTEKIKELKSKLANLEQNMDSVSCSANILFIESDRCWREQGAEVMFECSSSNEWLLVVKIQGSTRYTHKAQEMNTSICNRYTKAMMWCSGHDWKLEFCDRKDWFIFKELYRECRDWNMQAVSVRTIPVPGVLKVADCGVDEGTAFVRPDDYITVVNDEMERVLSCDKAIYDMDSEDEKFLEQLNCKSHDTESCDMEHISHFNFERIMFIFERAAYSCAGDVRDKDRASSLCPDLDRTDMATIFEYWLRKRKQRQSPLVRVFQWPSSKWANSTRVPKRNLKQQTSLVQRGKTRSILQAMAKQAAVQSAQEAEHEAKIAVELAVLKRRKAQMLMQNADLATYKAFMASQLAQAHQAGMSSDDFL